MKTRTSSSIKMPNYMYQKLPNGMVDIFVSKFIEEVEKEDGIEYIYESNQFRVSQDLISEEEVKTNPLKYLDYDIETLTLEDRISALEQATMEIAEEVFNG